MDILWVIEARVGAGFLLTGLAVGILYANQWKALVGVFVNLLAFACISVGSCEAASLVASHIFSLWAPYKLAIISIVFGTVYVVLSVTYVFWLSPKIYRGQLIFIFQEAWTTLSALRRSH
jgi:PST family polysaccharide transporter